MKLIIFKKISIALSIICVLFTVMFFVYNSVSASEINFLKVNFGEYNSQEYLGKEVEIADIKLAYPDKVESFAKSILAPDGDYVALNGNKFFAEKEGEYKVCVTVKGINGCVFTDFYSVNIQKASFPILSKLPIIPYAFVENVSYDVPNAKFIDYNTQNPTEVNYKVLLVDCDGNEKEVTESFKLKTNVNGLVSKLKYVATSFVTKQTNEVIYDVPVVKVIDEQNKKRYHFEKLFITENASDCILSNNGVEILGNKDYSVKFANNIYAGFEVTLSSKLNNNLFSSVSMIVSDIVDSNKKITLDISSNTDKQSKIVLNKKKSFYANGSLLNYDKGITLNFDLSTNEIRDNLGATVCAITETTNGEKFVDFTDSKVNVSFVVNDVVGDSALVVKVINTQIFTSDNLKDEISPYIILAEKVKTSISLGEDVVVVPSNCFDVITPNLKGIISIYKPNGEIAIDKNGESLFEVDASKKYLIESDLTGEYIAYYTAIDLSGNNYELWQSICVSDRIAPTLKLNTSISGEVKVGDKIKIPTCDYNDNISKSENMKLVISMIIPKGSYDYVKAGDEYTFSTTGIYYLRITVYDENYNIAYRSYKIQCK